jgi:hypothetical protein
MTPRFPEPTPSTLNVDNFAYCQTYEQYYTKIILIKIIDYLIIHDYNRIALWDQRKLLMGI